MVWGITKTPVDFGAGAAPSPLLTDLISYWKLDEASGTRVDSVGGNDLTDNNTVTQGAGKVDSAAVFVAANNEYLSRASNASLQAGDIDWTFALWFKSAAFPANQSLLGKDIDTGREYSIYLITTGQVTVLYGATFAQSLAVTANDWHLAIGWHDATANTLNVQVDNAAAVSQATAGAAPPVGAAEFRIGAIAYPGFPQYLSGSVDEVGFWKRVLTADERTQLYNGGDGVTYPLFV